MNKSVLCIGFQEGDSARLKERFSADGIEAVFEASPSHAIYNRLKQREFDLLFLRMDATPTTELIRTIKGIRSMTGSLLIFAARGERDAITVLEAGADVVLPAGASPELACRQALAVFRRQINRRVDWQTESSGRLIRFRDIVIDRVVHQVTKAGEPLELNPREYRLLTVLAEHPDVAMSTEEISRAVWLSENTYGRDLTPIVASLRRKLGGLEYIKTVRGVGYRIVSDP